ncbi:MAG: hypothetical protein ACREAC_03280 [Blastocatellia bacterium]
MRVRTTLGSVEYLEYRAKFRKDFRFWDARVALAAQLNALYHHLFPVQYDASQSPAFSNQREHEFYRLISERLFPLDVSMLDGDPSFVHPGIPIKGMQEHDWINGCCPFAKLQMIYKLALVLSGSKPEAWRSLGVNKRPEPPLGGLGWSLFVYACRVDPSPLQHLPLAFHMATYSTGSIWLDTPPGAAFFMEWTGPNIRSLIVAQQTAQAMNQALVGLEIWLSEDSSRVKRAVEVWNRAGQAARQELAARQEQRA